jgi:hypothetical protein
MLGIVCGLASNAFAGRSAGSSDVHRVRTDNAVISALLDAGSRGSATFEQIVGAIERTDGLVYVEPGTCPGYRIKGCLLHRMSAIGESRYLWIAMDLRDEPINLMVRLAHELRHALEILSDASIRTDRAILSFYNPDGSPVTRTFETAAALATGAAVRRELERKTTTESSATKR